MMMYQRVVLPDVTSGMPSGDVIRLESYRDRGTGRSVSMDSYQHQPAFESFAHPGTRIYERSCDVDGQATIRILHFQPREVTGNMPIVLVPGLSSVIESFRGLLQEITRSHVVIYVETREKPSSVITVGCGFDMRSIGRDVEAAISMCCLEDRGYLLAGYSLGAAAIMEAYGRLSVKPSQVVLAEPVPQFRIPVWSLPLARWAPNIFPALKPFAKWYMRNFMIDTRRDPEVMKIVERALDNADPFKLGQTLRSVHRYQAWDKLEALDSPTLIVATSSDTLHNHKDITRMKTLISAGTLLDMKDNQRTHSHEMAVLLRSIS